MQKTLLFWFSIIIAFIGAFYVIGDIFFPFIVSIILAHLLNPLIDKMACLKMPRFLRSLIIISILFLGIVLIVLKIVPVIGRQLKKMMIELPNYQKFLIDKVQFYFSKLSKEYNFEIGDEVAKYLDSIVKIIFNNVNEVINSIWQSGIEIAYFFSLLFLIPIITFYLLKDWHEIKSKLVKYVPLSLRKSLGSTIQSVNYALCSYVKGQINVCLLLALLYSTTLYFLGLDFALLIGIISGFLVFIPYIGFAVGIISGLLVAYIQFGDYQHMIYVAIIFIAGQVIEGSIITPNLVGEKIGIHPVWLMFLVLAGGQCFGFWGVILSVPLGAILSVLFRNLAKIYLGSKFYNS